MFPHCCLICLGYMCVIHQCCLDPIRIAHKVLDACIHCFPVGLGELALLEFSHSQRMLSLLQFVLLHLLSPFLHGSCGSALCELLGFFRTECGLCWSRVDTDHQTLEKGLDDVHDIGAEVPNHIEQHQHGQRWPGVNLWSRGTDENPTACDRIFWKMLRWQICKRAHAPHFL